MTPFVLCALLHAAPADAAVLTRPAGQQATLTADEALAVSLTAPVVRHELSKSGPEARPLTSYYVTAARSGDVWLVTWAVNDANVRDGALKFRVDLRAGAVVRQDDASGLLTGLLASDAGAPRRACADGVTVLAEERGRAPSPVSRADTLSIAELRVKAHGLRVLTPADARQLPGNPQLFVTQHVVTYKTEVFFVVRAALTELGTDASGRHEQLVVWRGEPASGVTSPESARDVLVSEIERTVGRALNECR